MQYGPARTVEQSTTRRPASGPEAWRWCHGAMVAAASGALVDRSRAALASRHDRSDHRRTPDPTPTPAARPAPSDPDDRPRPSRRRDDRDRRRDGQGHRGRPSGRPGHLHPRRDGRDRRPGDGHAGEPPPAGRAPGGRARAGDGPPRRDRVGEPRLPRLRHDGSAREPRPAQLLAGEPRRSDRPARLVRAALPARRHHDLQRLRRVRPPGPHPDPPRRGRGLRAGRRCRLVPGAARPRARRDRARGGGRRPRAVGAVQALRAGHPGVGPPGDGRSAQGARAALASGTPPEDATPEQIEEFEAYAAKMLVPDETVTTWLDISGAPVEAQVGRHPRARDPDQRREPVHAARPRWLAGGLVEGGVHPARVARRRPSLPETDLFAGIA